MCVVDKKAKLVFVFKCGDLFKFPLVSCHSKNTFSNDKNTSGLLFIHKRSSTLQLLFHVFNIVMLKYITLSRVQPYSINNTCMAFCIINNPIMPAAKNIDNAYHSLVSII